MHEIKIWAQMFFEDGTVSQGIRIPAEYLDKGYEELLEKTIQKLLGDMGREEGWFLLWGAGNMVFNHYPTSSSQESDSSDASQETVSDHPSKIEEFPRT